MTSAREKLEEALQELLAEGGNGEYLTGYAVVATGVLPDRPGYTAYRYAIPTDQPIHVSRGLVSMLVDAVGDYDMMMLSQAEDDEQ